MFNRKKKVNIEEGLCKCGGELFQFHKGLDPCSDCGTQEGWECKECNAQYWISSPKYYPRGKELKNKEK